MVEVLRNKLQTIIAKYERLNLDTPQYRSLVKMVKDEKWLKERAEIMSKIVNSEKIFDVSKEISAQKNDVRLDEAFAELDTGKNLATTGFYGTFDTVIYQPPEKNKRWPDFIAKNKTGITPVEVKLLTPSDLSETKFFQKFIDKVNNHAMPQLDSFYATQRFEHSYIFIWSYQPIPLHKLEYGDLRNWVDSKVIKPTDYDVTLLCNFYGIGMWDFPLRRS